MENILVEEVRNYIENNNNLKETLENFLKNNDLYSISKKVSKFNPFRVLKLEHFEIRHSNFIAWLLNPNESHNLKTYFLEKFLEAFNDNNFNKYKSLENVIIKREWENIDILIEGTDFVCAIENKIHSGENGFQLDKYKETVDKYYPDNQYQKKFIYLTLNTETPSNAEYKNITYNETILPIISEIIRCQELDDDIKKFLNHYINILEIDLQLKTEENAEILSGQNQYYEILNSLYSIKDNLSDITFKDKKLNKLYRQQLKAINVLFSYQKNLQDERDEKINKVLCQIFNNAFVAKHGGWAYKLDLDNKNYPFSQVDYTTLPFENVTVRFFCGIKKSKERYLKAKLRNETIKNNLINNKEFKIEVGFRIKNASGFGIINDFLTDNSKVFEQLFNLFESRQYGRKTVSYVFETITKSIFNNTNEFEKLKEIIKEKEYEQIIISPFIYISKELSDLNFDNQVDLAEKFKEITENGFKIWEINNYMDIIRQEM